MSLPWHTAPRFLVGSTAHNTHVQHIARALYESNALHAFVTGGVDSFRSPPLRWARHAAAVALPGASRQLSRRAVTEVPREFVRAH